MPAGVTGGVAGIQAADIRVAADRAGDIQAAGRLVGGVRDAVRPQAAAHLEAAARAGVPTRATELADRLRRVDVAPGGGCLVYHQVWDGFVVRKVGFGENLLPHHH